MPRIIKEGRGEREACVTSHCFPNIHGLTKPANGNGNGKRGNSVFHRINFETAQLLGPNNEVSPDSYGNAARNLEQQATAKRKSEYQEGFREGEKSGMEQERKKMQPVINNFRQALTDLEKVKRNLYRNAEEQAVELALAVARKIVCSEVSTNREVIINVVKEALERVSDQERIKIRVNPSAAALLADPGCTISDAVRNGSGICIEVDQTVASGGCIIETELGDVDARIEERLRVVEEALKSESAGCG